MLAYADHRGRFAPKDKIMQPVRLQLCILISSASAFALCLALLQPPCTLTEHCSDKTAERIVGALLRWLRVAKNVTCSHQCRGGQSTADGGAAL